MEKLTRLVVGSLLLVAFALRVPFAMAQAATSTTPVGLPSTPGGRVLPAVDAGVSPPAVQTSRAVTVATSSAMPSAAAASQPAPPSSKPVAAKGTAVAGVLAPAKNGHSDQSGPASSTSTVTSTQDSSMSGRAPDHVTAALRDHVLDHRTDGERRFYESQGTGVDDPLNWTVHASKSRHELDIYYEGRLYKTYHAVFGRSRWGGEKQWEGDLRTPEGPYLIVAKHPSRRFGWFLRLNYPNPLDQARFAELRAAHEIPASVREGGQIGIHGTDKPVLNQGNVNWTTGCISVDNSDIGELARLLPVGTLVVIKP